MGQLRHMIIIIYLMPIFLCFAQDSGTKTSSSPSAQKTETESRKTDSAQFPNLPVTLPPGFRNLPLVGLSSEADAWAVQIFTIGGLAGRGKGDLTITSRGNLIWSAAENQCQVKLRNDVVQVLTRTALSANASGWGEHPATSCKDCFVYALVLQRREPDGSEKRYIAYWDDSTAGKTSEEVRKVYETFKVYEGCKQ
jgi:hypothetical protein